MTRKQNINAKGQGVKGSKKMSYGKSLSLAPLTLCVEKMHCLLLAKWLITWQKGWLNSLTGGFMQRLFTYEGVYQDEGYKII
jgi:hypothetical protein